MTHIVQLLPGNIVAATITVRAHYTDVIRIPFLDVINAAYPARQRRHRKSPPNACDHRIPASSRKRRRPERVPGH
ncbi:hypothetical protein HMPREF1318_1596 [Actinomyces massiliensis F0489]|uniref:Uncharacterized protein n=1 Tax=Actinomyces massiliensis F0489 TaxID=1125718 RepID=J0N0V2_9ACTO|nr:hypothetical protein HMPREF1318_1596 [Actinomyces massiliensis F0489]